VQLQRELKQQMGAASLELLEAHASFGLRDIFGKREHQLRSGDIAKKPEHLNEIPGRNLWKTQRSHETTFPNLSLIWRGTVKVKMAMARARFNPSKRTSHKLVHKIQRHQLAPKQRRSYGVVYHLKLWSPFRASDNRWIRSTRALHVQRQTPETSNVDF
jgi:hypothetical protein